MTKTSGKTIQELADKTTAEGLKWFKKRTVNGITMPDIASYLVGLEQSGWLDPECQTCQTHFYPKIQTGTLIGDIFAPRHVGSPRCESGHHPHCSCDRCF